MVVRRAEAVGAGVPKRREQTVGVWGRSVGIGPGRRKILRSVVADQGGTRQKAGAVHGHDVR